MDLPAALSQPMSVRRQMRLAIVSALQAALSGVTIDSPGDWPTPPEKLPALLINVPSEQKQSATKGQSEFTTTTSIVIQGQVAAASASAAQDAIEQLAYQVENAILTDYWITAIRQQFTSVQTELEVTADGGRQLAGFKMTLSSETFEAFDVTATPPAPSTWPPADPAAPVALTEIQLHADLTNVYDPSGTYANPPFPASVTPAPRTTGPDGRDEGGLDIDLPQ